jgi:tRNA (guanine37-N1)-methyltransferase
MMNFHVMTLFPDMVRNTLSESITGRAIEKELIGINLINIRDFAQNKTRHVDDYIYGGGSGMLMQVEPVFLSFISLLNQIYSDREPLPTSKEEVTEAVIPEVKERRKGIRVLYMSPKGRTFDQEYAAELSKEENVVFLCGHYEGIDERALSLIEPEEVSLGDFVLTGGEIASIAMIDAVSRLVPGVLGNEMSYVDESFSGGLLEYPQYTRPAEYLGLKVPDILLSGDHAKVEKWRRAESEAVTVERRPDLAEKAGLTKD